MLTHTPAAPTSLPGAPEANASGTRAPQLSARMQRPSRRAERLAPRRRVSAPALKRTACPCCNAESTRWRPIRCGMVAESVLAQARRGEVVLGPVNHGRNEPQWACLDCDARFGRPREELDRFGRPLAARVAEPRLSAGWQRGFGPALAGAARRLAEVLEPAPLRERLASLDAAA